MQKEFFRLSPLSLGLALGVLWGGSVLFFGLSVYLFALGKPYVEAMGAIYKMQHPSLVSCFLSGGIAFIDAFVSGVLLAWLYNFFGNRIIGNRHSEKDSKQKNNNSE